mgnify:CR=1 FL=1
MDRILVINTGSTSTKVAIFEDGKKTCERNIEHPAEELKKYDSQLDQRAMRTASVREFLNNVGLAPEDFTAVAARGGSYAVFESGAYEVDQNFLQVVANSKNTPGASWNSCLIAADIAKEAGIKAYIYDAVSVDEMYDIAHLSGLPQIPRKAAVHTLNTKAVGRMLAQQAGQKYEDMNFVIAHMGGGISTSAHCKGRIVDLNADDEGTFSPERPGRVPCSALVDLCYSGTYTYKQAKRLMRGQGGLVAYLGTNSAQEVEEMIADGDETAKSVYEAMAYQISKDIAAMAAAMSFVVDRIILTGGIAHSKMLTDMIKQRVGKIAPVEIMAGSFEMEALASGVLRVLHGQEQVKHL